MALNSYAHTNVTMNAVIPTYNGNCEDSSVSCSTNEELHYRKRVEIRCPRDSNSEKYLSN